MFLAFLAAISPGPNIVLVMQNSMVFGRKNGLMTALGVVCGVLFWLVFLAVGFVYLVQKPKVLFVFHLFASVYLLCVVYFVLKIKVDKTHNEQTPNKAFFFESLVVTLLNPEIAIFYGSILTGIFAQSPEISNSFVNILIYITGFMLVEAFVFFSCAYFVSAISKFMEKYVTIIKITASLAICFFAIRMIANSYAGYQTLFA